MTDPQLSLHDARSLAVHAQQLAERQPGPPSREDVHETIRRLGCLQIDTIHVVARSPYLVLWSRLGDYDPLWLDELHYPQGALFEYWAHAACFIPIEHFRLFRPRMLAYASGEDGQHPWFQEHRDLLEDVLGEIRRRGPLGAAAFEAPADHAGGGWWNWKPAKRALDVLWTMGELMILRRNKFQRIYELRERVLPEWNDDHLPSEDERRRELASIALRAMGLATAKQLSDYFRMRQQGLAQMLEDMSDQGQARRVQVAGWTAPAYVHSDHWPAFERGLPPPRLTTFLSPFDNLVWHRQRTRELFDFDYTLECYVPAPKRRYGYFVLTILWRGMLVGRLDAKAERKAGVLRIKALYLEPGVPLDEALVEDLAVALQECADWHRTPEIVIERSEPDKLKPALEQTLQRSAAS